MRVLIFMFIKGKRWYKSYVNSEDKRKRCEKGQERSLDYEL